VNVLLNHFIPQLLPLSKALVFFLFFISVLLKFPHSSLTWPLLLMLKSYCSTLLAVDVDVDVDIDVDVDVEELLFDTA